MSDILDACRSGDVVRVRAALAADPRAVDETDDYLGSTPLIFAAHRGYLEIVDLLLDAGADVEKRERVSETTEWAKPRWADRPAVVRWLLDHGVEVDPFSAVAIGTLLQAGADTSLKDTQFGATPRGWAEFGGEQEIIDAFGS